MRSSTAVPMMVRSYPTYGKWYLFSIDAIQASTSSSSHREAMSRDRDLDLQNAQDLAARFRALTNSTGKNKDVGDTENVIKATVDEFSGPKVSLFRVSCDVRCFFLYSFSVLSFQVEKQIQSARPHFPTFTKSAGLKGQHRGRFSLLHLRCAESAREFIL